MKSKSKNTIGSIVTGAAEVAVVAGVTVAATLALKDEKSRKKTKKTLIKLKDQAVDYIETLKKEEKIKEDSSYQ